MEGTLNQDSVTLQDLDSDTVSFYTAKSVNDPRVEHQCQQGPLLVLMPTTHPASVPSAPPAVFVPTAHPASIPSVTAPPEIPQTRPASALPHFPDASESTMPVNASYSAEMV